MDAYPHCARQLVHIALLDGVIDGDVRFGYRQRFVGGQIAVQVTGASEEPQIAGVRYVDIEDQSILVMLYRQMAA